ncbi:hypothetical protein XH98_17200 [Bradyrhizobium sp. CCBAU 51745]|nr:hypothetical protein [Bradyrhizobium sp. CCBAU 51745]
MNRLAIEVSLEAALNVSTEKRGAFLESGVHEDAVARTREDGLNAVIDQKCRLQIGTRGYS